MKIKNIYAKILFLLILFFLGTNFTTTNPKQVYAQASCNWTPLNNPSSPYYGKPAFCVGDFDSVEELRNNNKVQFFCGGTWCGGLLSRIFNSLTGTGVQEVILDETVPDHEIGKDESGKYFTCFTGDFDQSITDVLLDINNDFTAACRIESIALAGAGLVSGNALVVTIGAASANNPGLCNEALKSVSGFNGLTIYGLLKNSNEENLCTGSLQLRLVPGLGLVTGPPGTAQFVSHGCLNQGYVNTAIGCIPFNIISETARFFLAWGLGVGGGVALFLIAISAITIAASSGNPEKINSAKSLLWSAIVGLGMLIFSVFLIRFIGVDVLSLFG